MLTPPLPGLKFQPGEHIPYGSRKPTPGGNAVKAQAWYGLYKAPVKELNYYHLDNKARMDQTRAEFIALSSENFYAKSWNYQVHAVYHGMWDRTVREMGLLGEIGCAPLPSREECSGPIVPPVIVWNVEGSGVGCGIRHGRGSLLGKRRRSDTMSSRPAQRQRVDFDFTVESDVSEDEELVFPQMG